MAQISLSSLLLLLSLLCIVSTVEPTTTRRARVRSFIKAQCQTTRYPELCVKYISGLVNTTAQTPQQFAQIALTVSISRAQYTMAYLTKVATELKRTKAKEYPAVKDCLYLINDGMDQLKQAVQELRRMGQTGANTFAWHESNVQTWVSTALTDMTYCVEGLSGQGRGGKLRATIKGMVVNLAQVTSNGLGLFNRFITEHRATGVTKKP